VLTYLDSNVLIAAASETDARVEAAIAVLFDAKRKFISSIFQSVEVLPSARRNRRKSEMELYEYFFQSARTSPRDYDEVGRLACQIIEQHAISSMDALHLASALSVGAEQLVTLESPRKGIAKTGLIEVLCLE
jgi:predicted nucleic acid-binding protein